MNDEQNTNNSIQLLLKQLLNQSPDNDSGNSIVTELRQFYLKQMKLRDRAARQLRNIRYAKERSGRVPIGMQIKVTPEVPGSEQFPFQTEWARALAGAEEALSDTITKHLTSFIQQIDKSIALKIKETLITMKKQ